VGTDGLKVVAGAAGADEAGRGALAGPVSCAAVLLPDGFDITGLDDSKKLTRRQREAHAERIKAETDWAVVMVSAEEIDKINILEASLQGMVRALGKLEGKASLLLVDGNALPACPIPVEAHVKGDGKFAAIAAASILAKTERDRFMREAAAEFPEYGFEGHVGYGAANHLKALEDHGPCPLHRRSFEPLKSMLNQPVFDFGM
jgi:ribonuclease HII